MASRGGHRGSTTHRGRIYRVVAAIPRGRVASYGQVAALAGLPRGARQVGRALAQCPPRLPWHRVLAASGKISLPPGDPAREQQRRRLAREGVVAINDRVSLRRFGWQPDLDELIWGPLASGGPANRGSVR